jgi:outer membrane protein
MRSTMLASAIAIVLGAGSARAQDTVLTLSVQEAVELARRTNPGFAQFRNDVETARLAERAGRGQYLPTLGVSMGLSGSYSRSVTGVNEFGELERRESAAVTRNSSLGQSVAIGLPVLFDGGARRNQLRSARARTVASEARVAAQDLGLRAAVERAYVAALAAQALEKLEEQLLASQEERLRLTEQMYRVASSNRIDLLGAREQLASRESNLAGARATVEKSRITLLTQLGVEPGLHVQLTDTLLPLFDPKSLDVEALVDAAQRMHPAVVQAEATREAAIRSLSAAKGGRWPRLSPSVSYSRGIGRQNYDAWTDLRMPENQSFGFGLSVGYNIFDRYQTSNNVAQAEAEVEDSDFTVVQQRQTVERDVRTAFIDLENAYRTLELARLSAGISAERLELSMEQYRLGSTSMPYTSLQTIIEGAANAERRVLDAHAQFAQALITLEERVGQRVRP